MEPGYATFIVGDLIYGLERMHVARSWPKRIAEWDDNLAMILDTTGVSSRPRPLSRIIEWITTDGPDKMLVVVTCKTFEQKLHAPMMMATSGNRIWWAIRQRSGSTFPTWVDISPEGSQYTFDYFVNRKGVGVVFLFRRIM